MIDGTVYASFQHPGDALDIVSDTDGQSSRLGIRLADGLDGSFVPAESAEVPLTDRVFTRIGAGDNLAGGASTFLVEMREVSNILHNATERSLIILDEVGRGTSTYDGVAVAWAVLETLHRVRDMSADLGTPDDTSTYSRLIRNVEAERRA